MHVFYHDPDAKLDYHMEWQDALSQDGDYIDTSTWVVPDGIAASSPSHYVGQERDGYGQTRAVQVTSVFLEVTNDAGPGPFVITNRVETVRGRTIDQSFELRLKEL